MHAAHNNNFIPRKHLEDAVRKTPQYRPSYSTSNSLILLRIVPNRRYGYIDRAKKVSAEADALSFIPTCGIRDLGTCLQPEDKLPHL
jgi:hypothetical protein